MHAWFSLTSEELDRTYSLTGSGGLSHYSIFTVKERMKSFGMMFVQIDNLASCLLAQSRITARFTDKTEVSFQFLTLMSDRCRQSTNFWR